jgi:hypothetical protein
VDIVDRIIHVNHSTGTVAVPSAATGISVHRGNNGTTDRDHAGLFWTGDSGSGLGITTGTFRLAANTEGDDTTLTTDLDLRLGTIDVRGNYSQTGSGTFTAGSGTTTLPNLGLGVVHSSSGGVLSSSAVVLTSEVSGTLPVANGGTGATTLTANGVVVGNGTSAVHVTAVGTAGHVLTSNGTGLNPTFQPSPAASLTIGTTAITSGTVGRILFEGAGNVVSQDSDLSFSTDTLTATNIVAPTSVTISSLTSGSIVFAGTAGILSQDNANLFWDDTNNRLGLLTTSPSSAIGISGNAARTIQMERHTTANTAGNSLTILAGSSTSGAEDKNGGNLLLSAGTASGTGSSNILFQVATAGATGTADRAPATKMQLTGAGELVPPSDNTGSVGTDALRWGTVRANNVVTGDLDMKAPDGTAHWTLIERHNRIVAINQKTGQRFVIKMELDTEEM